MEILRTSTFLRRVLLADAATCLAAGLLMLLGSGLLDQSMGLPTQLSRYVGICLLPFAVFLVYLATRENLSQPVVWAVIGLNALWTVDSILLLLSGWIEPTGLGYVFIIFQAFGVAMFAGLEYFGLRKSAIATV